MSTTHTPILIFIFLLLLLGTSACSRGDFPGDSSIAFTPSPTAIIFAPAIITPTPTPVMENHQVSITQISPRPSPTPDQIRQYPELRHWNETYVVRDDDDLMQIAHQYEVGAQQILNANGRDYSDPLTVGQLLIIPPPIPESTAPYFKIIPDSELVYGPSTVIYHSPETVLLPENQLTAYVEEINGITLDGLTIVQMVAEKYSLNPKLLLALLDFQCSQTEDRDRCLEVETFPLRWVEPGKEGLYRQLSWAADQLNFGFYRWQSGWNGPFIFRDGRIILPSPGVNAGTAAVQYLLSHLYPVEQWRDVVGDHGFYQVYISLFGDPFEYAIEPLLPPDLSQPALTLPFETGVPWSFTGGPHSSIGNWASWGALDFAPSMIASGCELSEDWVVAVADGEITRSYGGQVMQDLDEDGFEQTGWAVLYLHIATDDRVQAGTYLHRGDRIGHPSCEGGFSTGTHLHLARKYNGVWIPADGQIPFNLDGRVSTSTGSPYDGSMNRGGTELHACAWWRSCEISTYWGLYDPETLSLQIS